MKSYTDMYPIQDTDGMWVVARVIDGHIELTPWVYKTRDGAVSYCAAHGF